MAITSCWEGLLSENYCWGASGEGRVYQAVSVCPGRPWPQAGTAAAGHQSGLLKTLWPLALSRG